MYQDEEAGASDEEEADWKENEDDDAPDDDGPDQGHQAGAQSPSIDKADAEAPSTDKAGAESPSIHGLRFCCVVKMGDVFVTSRDMAMSEFTVLYDIRRQVQAEYSLPWNAFWHMPAQKACNDRLREVWKGEQPADKLEKLVARQRLSQYNTFCWQRFGGHQWVTLFFAFGTVDADCVVHFNVFWQRQVEKKGGKYRVVFQAGAQSPSSAASKAGAQSPSSKAGAQSPSSKGGPHLSERKRHKELLAQVIAERDAFLAALHGKGDKGKEGKGVKGTGKGKQAKGKPWWGRSQGEVDYWWCPALWKYLSQAELDRTVDEFQSQMKQFDLALHKEREENSTGSALNQAIYKIAEVKGLKQLAPPQSPTPGQGKGKRGKRY